MRSARPRRPPTAGAPTPGSVVRAPVATLSRSSPWADGLRMWKPASPKISSIAPAPPSERAPSAPSNPVSDPVVGQLSKAGQLKIVSYPSATVRRGIAAAQTGSVRLAATILAAGCARLPAPTRGHCEPREPVVPRDLAGNGRHPELAQQRRYQVGNTVARTRAVAATPARRGRSSPSVRRASEKCGRRRRRRRPDRHAPHVDGSASPAAAPEIRYVDRTGVGLRRSRRRSRLMVIAGDIDSISLELLEVDEHVA